jgi:hypothetical protein
MATYSALPATLNLVATVGNDFSLALTVSESGSPWVATGATLATDIISRDGTVVATDFTSSASTGSVTLSLTDANTTALGVGVYHYRLSVTKSSVTRDWIAGTLSIVEAGVGGSSTTSASLAISTTSVSLTLNSMVASQAANITVADADALFTGDTVEEVLTELGALAVPLPAANGSDDTTAIQAVLTAHAGKVIRGQSGESYIISAPLVISSGTTLDMTGCTITLAASSNCNMLRNTSYSTGTRDTDITIIGGTWDRGTVGGTGNNKHSLFLRRLDRVRVIGVRYLSTSGGKYGIALGDVTSSSVRDCSFSCSSDAVHITGPASNIVVERCSGTSGDDFVGMTTTDFADYDDVHGSITGVTIRDIAASSPTRGVLVSGSATGTADTYTLTDIMVDNVRQSGAGSLLSTGSYSSGETGYVDGLTIRNSSGPTINLKHITHKRIRIEGCEAPIAPSTETGGTSVVESLTVVGHRGTATGVVMNSSGATLRNLVFADTKYDTRVFSLLAAAAVGSVTIRNVHHAGSNTDFVTLAGSTLDKLTIEACHVNIGASMRVVAVTGGTHGQIAATDCYATAANTSSGEFVYVTAGTVDYINLTNCRAVTTAGLVRNVGSGGTLNIALNGVRATGTSRIVQGTSPLVITGAGVYISSTVNTPFFVGSSSTMTIMGSGFSGLTSTWVQRSASETVRVISPDLPADITILAKNAGDMCVNTAAASGTNPGTGPVVCDGTTWRLKTIGAVKTGTATLVGGTVTVADTAITANSVIRLAYRTIGGTPGAVYVSARTASTSFAITSTSGTDTSVIQYDIITY